MLGAVIRGSPCNNRAADRPGALRASLSFLPMLDEEPPRIVGATRFEVDRLLQHAPDVREERLRFVVTQTIDRTAWIDRRAEQRFVRVQIADAGDHRLRDQQRLDPSAAFVEQRAKRAQIELRIEGIGSEAMLADVDVW